MLYEVCSRSRNSWQLDLKSPSPKLLLTIQNWCTLDSLYFVCHSFWDLRELSKSYFISWLISGHLLLSSLENSSFTLKTSVWENLMWFSVLAFEALCGNGALHLQKNTLTGLTSGKDKSSSCSWVLLLNTSGISYMKQTTLWILVEELDLAFPIEVMHILLAAFECSGSCW